MKKKTFECKIYITDNMYDNERRVWGRMCDQRVLDLFTKERWAIFVNNQSIYTPKCLHIYIYIYSAKYLCTTIYIYLRHSRCLGIMCIYGSNTLSCSTSHSIHFIRKMTLSLEILRAYLIIKNLITCVMIHYLTI